MTRDGGAPAGSRAAWADEKKMFLQSTPGFSTYGNDDKVWNLLDVLQSVAKETGEQSMGTEYCTY